MREVNFIVGRFQPFHNGHARMAQYGYDKNSYPTVLCVTPGDKDYPSRTPFLIDSILDDVVKHSTNIIGWLRVPTGFIGTIEDVLQANGYAPKLWLHGTDRKDTYEKQLARIDTDVELCEVIRPEVSESATEVRKALHNGLFSSYVNLMPWYLSDMKHFTLLKEQL